MITKQLTDGHDFSTLSSTCHIWTLSYWTFFSSHLAYLHLLSPSPSFKDSVEKERGFIWPYLLPQCVKPSPDWCSCCFLSTSIPAYHSFGVSLSFLAYIPHSRSHIEHLNILLGAEEKDQMSMCFQGVGISHCWWCSGPLQLAHPMAQANWAVASPPGEYHSKERYWIEVPFILHLFPGRVLWE